ncbi:MAG TPA: hypothetical protein VND64_24085 [Pirellulales bacterium]|nr:hypothetical protein [Pirellulales bacterium]
MHCYTTIERLAKEFDRVYPPELSARLGWWRHVLGIDSARFLRMLGMSAEQAARRKGEDFEGILEDPGWEENALLVEGSLHRLLSLFHYDWHALAARIHAPVVKTKNGMPSRVSRQNGEADRPRYTPNGDASDLLINRMADGGPQSLSALMAYLAESQGRGG